MKIFLVGYMGCGKTTLGRPLARRLGMRFVDMDGYLVDRCGRTIPEIFESEGETGFREREREVLDELMEMEGDAVISTGGGAPCFFDNMARMNACGTTVYLRVSPEGLAARLRDGRDKRPLLRGKDDVQLLAHIRETLREREVFYGQARMAVDCDGFGDAEIVSRLAERLAGDGK